MGRFFDFVDEDGNAWRVVLEVLEKDGATRRYGIREEIFQSGIFVERVEANSRFLTREEAEQTIEMLCRFQVTPCTLCDVI